MSLRCDEGEGGSRLDLWVAERTGLSRSRIQQLISEGRVRLDGRPARKSQVVDDGSRVEVEIPPPRLSSILPEAIPLQVVHEDQSILVVDKVAGMVVHPAPGHSSGTLVNALLHHVPDLSGIGGELRPGIVHRLDKDTSGLMVVAKSQEAHQTLSEALRQREVRRQYLALTWGHLDGAELRIDAPIGRHPKDRKRMAVVEGGRPARTRVRIRERWRAAELLDVALDTGRTHQIRVHLAHLGHPVVGDSVYGAERARGMSGPDLGWARDLARRVHRQFLHAAQLDFLHPISGVQLTFRSALPADLASVAQWVREEE